MPAGDKFTYRGSKTNEISFPLGGIGSGSIGLAGNGRLIDWEIYNRPNKGSFNGFSHFAIRAEQDGRVIDARVLNGDLHPPYSGTLNGPDYNAFGFGPSRETLSGLPHFRETAFTGRFPLAELEFIDPDFPGQIRLLAFNPFIPLNDFDSSIPAAFFEFEVVNTTRNPLTYLLAGTLSNPTPANQVHTLYNEVTAASRSRVYLNLRSDGASGSPNGDLTLAIDGDEVSAQPFWFRGAWFDSLEVYWREFSTQPGDLKPRAYPPETAGERNSGSLASRFTLLPDEKRTVRFVIAWNFPWVENYWNAAASQVAQAQGQATRWKNFYATRFESAFFSAQYALENWQHLYDQTCQFTGALYSSTLEPLVIEAIGANLAVIKTATVLRLEDGTLYGLEGCHSTAGCCEGSCTHVWNYAQAVPFLFPALERSMRVVDFSLNQREDGAMRFRLPLPASISAEAYWVFHPCADGQFGNVLKAYGDWKVSGDYDWLAAQWPAVKKAIEFAWAPSNEYRWDPDRSGVLSGRQHHTLDMELFSPNAWLNGFYLAALKAGAEMAEALGEAQAALEYREIFARGKAWTDRHLFNGQYYQQQIDLGDQSLLQAFQDSTPAMTGSVMEAYWNAEHGEIKYQIGEGCEIDQLLAQWHANLYGLGEIFDSDQARTALESLFNYNFKASLRGFYNPCRVFALNDEAGLVMCAWPEGRQKPVIPVPYSQEVMTGFEYAAAGLMIQSGLVEEGLQVVRAIRGRYDGEKRNPWNEIECGSNYARAMASYGLLLAFSGFCFDMGRGMIGFDPVRTEQGRFETFWCLGTAWGVYQQDEGQAELEVLYGQIEIKRLGLPGAGAVEKVEVDGRPAAFSLENGVIVLAQPGCCQKIRVTFTG